MWPLQMLGVVLDDRDEKSEDKQEEEPGNEPEMQYGKSEVNW
jgi:hypothetical protein